MSFLAMTLKPQIKVHTGPNPKATSNTAITLKMAQECHQETSTHRWESLKGINPRFLGNLHYAKKLSKKGLGKMQTSNTKA